MKRSYSAAADQTPVALSLVYRIWLHLARAPCRTSFESRLQYLISCSPNSNAAFLRSLLRWSTASGPTGASELNFVFVRLLRLMAHAPECAAILLRASTDYPGAEEFFSTELPGMLRLSGGAVMMTTELVEFIAVMCGSDPAVRSAMLLDASSSHRRDRPQSLRILQRREGHALFLRAFLGATGRNVLLVAKHLGSAAIAEGTRTSIVRVLYQLGSRHAGARKILTTNETKWCEAILPQLPTVSDRQLAQEHLNERKEQLRWLKELHAILKFLPTDAPQSTLQQQQQQQQQQRSMTTGISTQNRGVHRSVTVPMSVSLTQNSLTTSFT